MTLAEAFPSIRRRTASAFACMLAAALLIGCADKPDNTASRAGANAPTAKAASAPSTMGAATAPASRPTSPALTEYMGRTIAQTMHYTGAEWLTRESRQREEDCKSMLAHLGVKEEMAVCDMGCGNGFYSLKLAGMVGPKGKVLAVDIQQGMLDLLSARAKEAQVSNIEPILGDVDDPHLPAGSVDICLCVDVYHEIDHPVEMLAAMRKALKPDGRLVLVEFRGEDDNVPIKPLHKMSKAQVKKEMAANRFEAAGEYDGLPWQHMMFFKAAADGK